MGPRPDTPGPHPSRFIAPDLALVREREYRWSKDSVYLNAASYGPLPECSRRAVEEFDRRRQQGMLADPDFIRTHEDARHAVARLLGAHPAEIALVQNTNVGVNIGAHIVRAHAAERRRRIVVSHREFPANVYPWLALERDGFKVELVPANAAGNPDIGFIEELIEQPDVAALAISFVQFATGYRADLERLGELCRNNGVLFIVDAIQGLGVVPLDVSKCAIDVLASGAQKWLCSPFGTGFAYVRADLCRAVEPDLPGWLSFKTTQDFTRLVDYDYVLVDDATRFEVGTRPFQSCAGLAESVELLLSIGIDQVWEHNQRLQQILIDWIAQRDDVQITSDLTDDARSGIICIRPREAAAAHAALLAAGVTCSLREGSIRLSPHFYNNREDVARVLDVLEGALR